MRTMMMVAACALLTGGVQAGDLKEEGAIKARFEQLSKAFNAKDAKAAAALWAEDGDLINPAGIYAKGRADVEKVIAGDIEHFIAAGTTSFSIEVIRLLGKDLAIVNATHTVSGIKGPDGAAKPDAKVLVTCVMQKRAGQWWCLAARPMVPVMPPAPPAASAPAASAPTAAAAMPSMPSAGGMKK